MMVLISRALEHHEMIVKVVSLRMNLQATTSLADVFRINRRTHAHLRIQCGRQYSRRDSWKMCASSGVHSDEPKKAPWKLIPERIKVAAMASVAMGHCSAVQAIMSVAIVPMSAVHGWSSRTNGIIQSSYLWGYLLSPVLGGALTDKYGGSSVLGWGVLLWSTALLATPWAVNHSLIMLLAARASLGLAQGVAFPCMNGTLSRWFPDSERVRAVAASMAGFQFGNGGGLLLTPVLLSAFGISGPFVAFGGAGIAWWLVWSFYFYGDPQSHPSITKEELASIQHGKSEQRQCSREQPHFSILLTKLPVWAIIVANIMSNCGHFILLAWMPPYFNKVLGVDLKQAAWFSAVPWVAKALVGLVAGASSDLLVSSGVHVTTVRKIMQTIAFLGPALALIGLNSTRKPAVATAWLTTGLALAAFSNAGFLVNYQEVAPRFAGLLQGTFFAMVSMIGVGCLVDRREGSFQLVLLTMSGLYIASTLFWIMFCTGNTILD